VTTDIKAIETVYRGVRFRSRLEARWAVYFDAFGVPWEYEPDRYRLRDGRVYIPDFRLDGRVLAEVKPLGGDFEKAAIFDGQIILLEGPPSVEQRMNRVWHCAAFDDDENNCRPDRRCTHKCPGFNHDWVFIGFGKADRHFFWLWGEDAGWWFDWFAPGLGGDLLVRDAVSKALSARFGAY
jgi:hypothetical protein